MTHHCWPFLKFQAFFSLFQFKKNEFHGILEILTKTSKSKEKKKHIKKSANIKLLGMFQKFQNSIYMFCRYSGDLYTVEESVGDLSVVDAEKKTGQGETKLEKHHIK